MHLIRCFFILLMLINEENNLETDLGIWLHVFSYCTLAVIFAALIKYLASPCLDFIFKVGTFYFKRKKSSVVVLSKNEGKPIISNQGVPFEDDQKEISMACEYAQFSYTPGYIEICMELIFGYGLDVNTQDVKTGLTIFQCACLSGNSKLVESLLPQANLAVNTVHSDSPLHLATYGYLHAIHQDMNIINMLLDKGCDVNAQNKSGFTALHQAVIIGNVQLVKLLLKRGARAMRTNANSHPLDCSIILGHEEITKILKEQLHQSAYQSIPCETSNPVVAQPIRRAPVRRSIH